MTLTSARPRRSNGIPTTKTITNVSNEDGTFTRTTKVIYINGTEITTKETLTALEIEQFENQDSCAAEGTTSSTRDEENFSLVPSYSTCSSLLRSFINRNDDSMVVLYHTSTFLVLISSVCAMHENTFASILSFFCSFIAIPMMYNLGSEYKKKNKNSTWSMIDKWLMTCIPVLTVIWFIFSILYAGVILFTEESYLEDTILGTLWNIITFIIVAGRAEYLFRKQRKDEVYEFIHTFQTSYVMSFFLFVVSMMNGYTCAIALIFAEPFWNIQNVVMWIIYILFSKVAFVLM